MYVKDAAMWYNRVLSTLQGTEQIFKCFFDSNANNKNQNNSDENDTPKLLIQTEAVIINSK